MRPLIIWLALLGVVSINLSVDNLDEPPIKNIFGAPDLLQFAELELDNRRPEQAIDFLNQALDLEPSNGPALNALGKAYMLNGQFEKSFEACIKMHKLKPNDPNIYSNMAYLFSLMNFQKQALDFYTKALEQDPDNSEAQLGLGFCYLTLGDFKNGWRYYQARFKRGNITYTTDAPLWKGESLDNKTILLIAEQGLGDTIQFIRFARLLKQRYQCTIKAAVQPALIPLIKTSFNIIESVQHYDLEYEEHDYYIPMLSLPLALNINHERDIPLSQGYIKADQSLVDHWQSSVSSHSFNVGICWQANAYYLNPYEHAAAMRKSMPPANFEILSRIPNVQLYNLHKDVLHKSNSFLPPFFVTFENDFDETHGRFMDTAAIIEQLDLIITADTAIAHLAGALSKEVWVLLPEPADWRWMLNRTDTPWYSKMRLFRQKNRGDWIGVMEEVKKALVERINKSV